MRALSCIIVAVLLSIGPCQADTAEKAALFPVQGASYHTAGTEPLDVPPWVIDIPAHSFVGISMPCASMEEARQQAIDSAIGQILQAMGAEYQLTHESVISGNLRESRHELYERLSYTARWIVNSVQQHITRYAFRETGDGEIAFVLVRMTPSELDILKRLTIGAKLSAVMRANNGGNASIEVGEVNGVGVTLTGYRIDSTTIHAHAQCITLFFWKVPESDSTRYEGALPSRLSLKDSAGRVTIPVPGEKNGLKSLLMGSTRNLAITLTGYDEIGRPVSLPVSLH